MFVVNSRLGLSSVAFLCSVRSELHIGRPSFSLSYGCFLPSSLTRVLPLTLGFSPRLPVSVLVRAASSLLETFLDSLLPPNSVRLSASLSITSRPSRTRVFPPVQPTGFDALFHPRARLRSCVLPSLFQTPRVQDSSPVSHRLRFLPRLRPRLSLGRRSLPRIPSAFGGTVSHRPFRYSYRHSHFQSFQHSFRYAFSSPGTLPYPSFDDAASVLCFSPVYFRRSSSRPVSYYALF